MGAPDPVAGQYTDQELFDLYPEQLALIKTAWAGRDADYVARIEAAEAFAALGERTPWTGGMPVEIENDFHDGIKYPKAIRTVDGRQVDFTAGTYHADGTYTQWQTIDHKPIQHSRNGRSWWWKKVGALRDPTTGNYLVYRSDEKTKKRTEVEGVIGADINDAAAFLTPEERAQLGLPEVFNAEAFAEAKAEAVGAQVDTDAGDTAKNTTPERVEMMNALKKQLTGDSAKPDAALEWVAQLQSSRLAALAAGQSSPHSPGNTALLHAQAARRGATVVGWASGAKQWAKQERVLKPGAVPYEIWMPIVKPVGATTPDDETDTASGDTTSTASVSRMPARRNADGTELIGFKAVTVYDYTQTLRADGKPDPDWSPSIPGGDEALLAKFKASSPLPIVEDHGGNHTGTAHGWTNGRKIVLDPHRTVGSQLSALAHELGHVELGHIKAIKAGTKTRAECEQEAQLVAYQVLRGLGLGADADEATTQGTADYLRNWGKSDGTQAAGHKARWKLLQARITPASDAAHRILTRFYGLGQEHQAVQAA